MKIFGIDTSTGVRSAAVMEDGKLLAELCLQTGKKPSEKLAPAIKELFYNLGLSPAEVEGYAVGLGPGSFTGLRTGISLLKGMAMANPAPVIGVSSLEALARSAVGYKGRVLPLIDAKKGQVFTARFQADGEGGLARISADLALDPAELPSLEPRPLLLGEGLRRYQKEIVSAFSENVSQAPENLWTLRASWVCELARPLLEKGESQELHSLLPVYVRNTDQELKLGPPKKG
ncbi:MAG: tRNA (adenosine(37)-N6)-threonylcarbamoyltransferase complex dimerization subunit type 1 TsaB [bacterium]